MTPDFSAGIGAICELQLKRGHRGPGSGADRSSTPNHSVDLAGVDQLSRKGMWWVTLKNWLRALTCLPASLLSSPRSPFEVPSRAAGRAVGLRKATSFLEGIDSYVLLPPRRMREKSSHKLRLHPWARLIRCRSKLPDWLWLLEALARRPYDTTLQPQPDPCRRRVPSRNGLPDLIAIGRALGRQPCATTLPILNNPSPRPHHWRSKPLGYIEPRQALGRRPYETTSPLRPDSWLLLSLLSSKALGCVGLRRDHAAAHLGRQPYDTTLPLQPDLWPRLRLPSSKAQGRTGRPDRLLALATYRFQTALPPLVTSRHAPLRSTVPASPE